MPFIGAAIGAIAGAIGSAVAAVGSFLGGLGVVGKLAIGIGLNLAASALMKKGQPEAEPAGVKIQTEYGADVPRQVAMGLVGIAGHNCHVNTYGADNKFLQDVYQLSDYPIDGLSRLAINGEWVTLDTANPHPERGWPVTSGEYAGRLWLKLYDGRQTAADPNLVEEANPAGRWTAQCIGLGCAYAILTAEYDREKTVGMPDPFFEVRGARLYDWRKDSTVGGSGPHRWDDPSTWEYTENPIVMEYNYRRGLSINGDLFCGMEMDAADLPLDRYTAAANLCDETVDGEPRYRCSVMIDCTATHGENIESLMKSCGGVTIDAVDGSWPLVGSAQPVVAVITDDDLVVGEPVAFQRYRSMQEIVNAISGTHPDPDQLWSMVGYEPIVLDAYKTTDRRTRDLAMDFPTVRSARQAKQLASIYAVENRLEATAEITVRPRWQVLKPGDWIRWESARYGTRTWMVTSRTLYSLDSETPRVARLALTERDASMYDGVTTPVPVVPLPPGKPVYLQQVQSLQLAAVLAGTGDKTMPAIQASWAPIDDVTVIGVEVQWWPTGQPDAVAALSVPSEETVALLIEGVVSDTEYQVRTRLITSPKRIVAWSDPQSVTTLSGGIRDVYPIDIGKLQEDVQELHDWLGAGIRYTWDRLEQYSQRISDLETLSFSQRQTLRREAVATADNLRAGYTEAITVAVDGLNSDILAVSSRVQTLEASYTDLSQDVSANASAVSALDTRVTQTEQGIAANATSITELESRVDGAESGISGNASAVSALDTRVTQTEAQGRGANWWENSDLGAGLDGYRITGPGVAVSNNGPQLRADQYAPPGGAIQIAQTDGVTDDAQRYVDLRPTNGAGADMYWAVVEGQRYELSAYLYAHRCHGHLYIAWEAADGSLIGYSGLPVDLNQNGNPASLLSAYARPVLFGTAPAGAARARPFIRKRATLSGASSYLWIVRPFFSEARVGQTEASPWSSAGSTTITATAITALDSRLTTAEGDIQGQASALSSLDTRVTNAEGEIAANSSAITGVQSQVDDVSAEGLFKTETYASPGGGWARIGMRSRVSTSSGFAQAAIFLDAKSDGSSRIVLDAQSLYFGDLSSGATINPLVYQSGVWAMNVANIGTVTAGLLKSPDNKFVITLSEGKIEWFD